ncbi:MAG: hypothetical protein SNH28_00610 [Rikenellaceae bacterium]
MIKLLNRWYVPTVVAFVVYALISMLYFAPQLSGDVLVQGDVVQYEGMSKEIIDTREATGEDPQWTGAMFGGMPAYMINVAYPSQIIKRTVARVTNIISTPAAFILFAMMAMWLSLVMMGVNAWVAIAGGVMYGLSTYFFLIIGAGHITKMWALVYAPLMFAGCYMTLRGNMWQGAALTALFTSLEIGASHPQITYYFMVAMAAFWLSEAIYSHRGGLLRDFMKRTAILVVAGVLAVGSNLSPLWYTYQHTPDTTRGGSVLSVAEAKGSSGATGLDLEYATAWSYGVSESLNLLIPDFMGRDSAHSLAEGEQVVKVLQPLGQERLASQLPAYWGTQPFTGGPTYIGAVVIFLALLGLCLCDARQRWWVVGVSLVMLLLAWGRNMMWFTELAFDLLPGYNKFRTVSMTLTVLEWTAPLMAAVALSKLWAGGVAKEKMTRALGVAVACSAGVALLLIVGGRSLFGYGEAAAFEMLLNASFPESLASSLASAMAQDRYSIMAGDAWRTVAFVAVAAVVVWLFYKGKISRYVMLALVGVIVVADLAPVNARFLSYDDFTSPSSAKIRPSAVDKQILSDKEPGFRVFNLSVSPFNDATTSYFHRSVGGYHGAKLSRYQDLIDNYLVNQNDEVLDMLNTKYIIVPTQEGSTEFFQRASANGAAWFVEELIEVPSAREEMRMLGEISTKNTALVERGEARPRAGLAGGEITLTDYKPHHLTYRYSAPSDAVAIFSEVYYDKGWSAYIDGVESPYFRANYLLRAMELPAGEHIVEWRFKAPAWGVVEMLAWICSILIVISLLVTMIYGRGAKIKA